MPYLPPEVARRYAPMPGTFDAGRGCPFLCRFCTIINVQGRKSRYRSSEDVEQLLRANLAHGIRHYFITDNNLARNPNLGARSRSHRTDPRRVGREAQLHDDITLPVRTGELLCRRLRRLAETKLLPMAPDFRLPARRAKGRRAQLCAPMHNTAGGCKDKQAGNFVERNRLNDGIPRPPLRLGETGEGVA
jgi:hypothetical protein